MPAPIVLIIDDDETARQLAAEDLAGLTARVLTAGDVAAGVALAREAAPDVVLLDIRLPARAGVAPTDCGLDAIAALRASGAAVVVVSSHDSAAAGMRALREGATDFIAKPYAPEQLMAAVERVRLQRRADRELAYLRREAASEATFLVGETAAMRAVAAALAAAGPTDAAVLVTGETGTGKELVARAVHAGSLRRDGPFVAINVAAIPHELVESTLFGHERGAFTGASAAQPGRFEVADGGTLFFDEIGELAPALQVKLLRVLQEASYERVGGQKALRADVRIVAATSRDLPAEVAAGRFRRDLFYRLNVIPIALPPLRERVADLGPLLELFLDRYARRHGRPRPTIGAGVIEELAHHDWPGNIRELEHLAQRLIVLGTGAGAILVDDLPLELRYAALLAPAPAGVREPMPDGVLKNAVAAFERDFILKTLARCGDNRTRAARLLGIHPATMFRKLNRHELFGGEVEPHHPSAGTRRAPDEES